MFMLFISFALCYSATGLSLGDRGRARPQFHLELQKRFHRRDATLEVTGVATEERLGRSGRIQVDSPLEILPESSHVPSRGSKLKIINVHHQESFALGVSVNARPVGDGFPATTEHALLAIIAPDVPG